jgi:hypothetical protein
VYVFPQAAIKRRKFEKFENVEIVLKDMEKKHAR